MDSNTTQPGTATYLVGFNKVNNSLLRFRKCPELEFLFRLWKPLPHDLDSIVKLVGLEQEVTNIMTHAHSTKLGSTCRGTRGVLQGRSTGYRKDRRIFLPQIRSSKLGVLRSFQVQTATSHEPFHPGLYVPLSRRVHLSRLLSLTQQFLKRVGNYV